MALPLDNWARSTILLAIGQFMVFGAAQADTRTTDDYIALVVEAEDHSSRDERWVLTEPSTPAQENDPDANHSDQAVGQAYLELLPDIRVTHDDPFGPPTAYWDTPGTGPKASYPMNFPEAGRYYVHLRAYSTGTEDNGIHVGLNNEWPSSGARMQFCTAGGGWSWSGRQRDAGGVGPCGAPKTIWLTVEEPGMNTVMISAREDGFEVDRIMLIKDLSDNTRICKPSGADDISCVNGSLENVDDVVDMAVELETETTTLGIEEEMHVTAIVRNRDGYDTAKQVVLNLDLSLGTKWDAVSVDEACEINGLAISCSLGQVRPSGPENEKLFEFTLQPLRSGTLSIPASIDTSSIDDAPANDEASIDVDVSDENTLSQLTVEWSEPSAAWVVDAETVLQATVTSTGVADAEQARIRISLPGGLVVTSLPDSCTGVQAIECAFESLPIGDDVVLSLGITPSNAGVYSAAVNATADNLDGEDIGATTIITVTEEAAPAPEPEPSEGGETPGGADTGSSDSGSMGLWLFMLLALVLISRERSLSPVRRVARYQVEPACASSCVSCWSLAALGAENPASNR